jgi:phosphoribosyl-dephospho-CoA transferase
MGAGDYPAGAYNDPRAPYNEELTKEKEYFVSITISFTLKGEINKVNAKKEARDIVNLNILSNLASKNIENINIDELEVVEE